MNERERRIKAESGELLRGLNINGSSVGSGSAGIPASAQRSPWLSHLFLYRFIIKLIATEKF
jgi:hypothetical protein